MILYFADRHMNILGQASTELPKGLHVSDDLKTEEVEAGVATLEFTLNYTDDTRKDAKQYSSVGNYILRKNGDEQEFYTIITSEEDIFKQEVEIYAEDAGMDLLNETVGEYKADKAYPASYYVEKFSDDSGFEVGINEVSNYNRKLSWDGETTASERILSVATQFDAEVSYTFEIDRLKIKHKYINLHKKRGVDQGRELRINREVKNIIVKSSVEDLATALSVTGGYPEDSETPINLKGYKYDDGDIYLSGSTIYSRSAVAKWSRYLSEKGNGTGHIVQTYTYDTLSQSELCNRAVSKLKKIYDAAVSYEVELAYLPDGIKIGDTVNIVDDAGELYLSARIMKLESSICNDEYTATLGEYQLKSSGISEKMENLAAQFEKLAKNRTFYTWVVFADTETGDGISLKSAGKTYMGIAYNQTTKQPVLTDPSIYAWVKAVGDQGIAGEPGKDGLTSFFHVRYADVPNPTANQMRKDTGKYIGTYVDYTAQIRLSTLGENFRAMTVPTESLEKMAQMAKPATCISPMRRAQMERRDFLSRNQRARRISVCIQTMCRRTLRTQQNISGRKSKVIREKVLNPQRSLIRSHLLARRSRQERGHLQYRPQLRASICGPERSSRIQIMQRLRYIALVTWERTE